MKHLCGQEGPPNEGAPTGSSPARAEARTEEAHKPRSNDGTGRTISGGVRGLAQNGGAKKSQNGSDDKFYVSGGS